MISSVFPLSAKMSLTVKTLYTPHPTLWSTTWCYLSADQRQFQYCLIQPQHLQWRYPPWVASVQITSSLCIITSSQFPQVQSSRHLTSFQDHTSISTPEKVYQSTQINEKKWTNLILLIKIAQSVPGPQLRASCSALSCSPRYPPRIACFSHSLHLSEKDTNLLLNFIPGQRTDSLFQTCIYSSIISSLSSSISSRCLAHLAQLFQYPSLSTYFRHRKWFLLCSPYQLKMSSTFVTFNNLLYIILPNDLQRGVISVHINGNFSFDSFNRNIYSQVSFMSCFSTNNPITLYNHFITISAGSELKAPNLLPRAD